MNARERSITKARSLIPDETLIEFFRAIRRGEIMAVKLMNKELDAGRTLDQIFITGGKWGYELSVRRLPRSMFHVSFGYAGDLDVGDGGTWDIEIDVDGNISRVVGKLVWIC